MSLTTGRGPFSRHPAGHFNTPLPDELVYVEPFRRRLRGLVGDRTVVDSERIVLVHRAGLPPAYACPAGDVHGVATDPESAVPGYVRVPWEAADDWWDEDEPLTGHPRNPYHRVDYVRTRRRLRVEVGGTTLVDTTDTVGVYETSLEPLLYVAPVHVRMDLLRPSDTTTFCGYKGVASYWTAVIGDTVVADVAWSYEDPLPESQAIRGLLCFDGAHASVHADLPSAHLDGAGETTA